jgi:hypothetical protein
MYRETYQTGTDERFRWAILGAICGVNFEVGARYGMFSGSREVRKCAGEVTFRTAFQREQFENPGRVLIHEECL